MGLLKDILNALFLPQEPAAPGSAGKSVPERAPASGNRPASTPNTTQTKNKVNYSYKPFKASEYCTIKKLSSLRKPNTDQISPPPVSTEWGEHVITMATSFFSGHSDILQDSSGNIQSDRQIAMERLIRFFAAVRYFTSWDYSFINELQASPGKLKWNYRTSSTSCYDGGSGGTTDYEYWMELLLLNTSWDNIVAQFNPNTTGTKETAVTNLYTGSMPGGDCDCLLWREPATSTNQVYFRNPFGLKGVYYYKDYYNMY